MSKQEIDDLTNYINQKSVPGGTNRNWDSYGDKIGNINEYEKMILADPQTSGGLLISVAEDSVEKVKQILTEHGVDCLQSIGSFIQSEEKIVILS